MIIPEYLSWGIILIGVFYCLYLCISIPKGVFFNGDGSLKALLARQFSQGELSFDLIEKAENWVYRLWQEGLYTYQPPFVYYLNQRYYISFPFPFSLLTAPFYRVLGYQGFYLVPLLSTWILWLSFYGISPSLSLGSWGTFLGLFILIFASPLTLYSGMYWEHTLSVVLGFIGITLAFLTPDDGGLIKMIIGGFLVGLSPWFRSECIALIPALTVLVFFGLTPQQDFILQGETPINLMSLLSENSQFLIFVGSMFSSLLLYWLGNKIIYNRFLGIHALLILDEFSWSRRIREAILSFQQLNTSFFQYFPVAWLPLVYLLNFSLQESLTDQENQLTFILLTLVILGGFLLVILSQGFKSIKQLIKNNIYALLWILAGSYLLFQVNIPLNQTMIFIYALYLIYTLGVACLVDFAPGESTVGGKQWGPRYLLPLIPFITWMSVEQLGLLSEENSLVAYGTLGLFLIGVGIGTYKNVYQGLRYFRESHQGIGPAIKRLERYPHPVIAFSHQYAAQALGFCLRGKKTFFCVENGQQMIQLCQGLIEQNIAEFLYVCYPHRPCKFLEEDTKSLQFHYQDQLFRIERDYLGIFGKYPVYEITISPKTEDLTTTASPVSSELVCTLLPTYNEKDNIRELIERLLQSVKGPYLILVIDDNSPDGTWKIVEEIAQKYPLSPDDPNFQAGVILKRRIDERGLTSALQRGIDDAIHVYNAKIITWMDCDLSMPPEDVPKLVKGIQEDKADLAVGSRWIPGGDDVAHGVMARILSWIINHAAIILLGDEAHDYTSGFIAARSEVLRQIPLTGDYGEYCIDLLCRASRLGYKLVEVPYLCVPRIYGESKTGINLWDYLDKGRNYAATIGKLWLKNS